MGRCTLGAVSHGTLRWVVSWLGCLQRWGLAAQRLDGQAATRAKPVSAWPLQAASFMSGLSPDMRQPEVVESCKRCADAMNADA